MAIALAIPGLLSGKRLGGQQCEADVDYVTKNCLGWESLIAPDIFSANEAK